MPAQLFKPTLALALVVLPLAACQTDPGTGFASVLQWAPSAPRAVET
jgi:hypothetical protein